MPPWVWALLVNLAGPVRDALNAVGQWVSGLVGTIHRVLGGIRGAWNALYSRVRGGIAALGHALSELYSTAWWIINIWIPKQLLYWNSRISHWVLDGIHKLDRLARGLVDAAKRLLIKAINGVRDALSSFARWAQARLADLRSFVDWFTREVLPRLTSPSRFAEWVIAAIISALWRYVYKQRDRIAFWFLRTSPAFTLWLARTLDDIIGRIL